MHYLCHVITKLIPRVWQSKASIPPGQTVNRLGRASWSILSFLIIADILLSSPDCILFYFYRLDKFREVWLWHSAYLSVAPTAAVANVTPGVVLLFSLVRDGVVYIFVNRLSGCIYRVEVWAGAGFRRLPVIILISVLAFSVTHGQL